MILYVYTTVESLYILHIYSEFKSLAPNFHILYILYHYTIHNVSSQQRHFSPSTTSHSIHLCTRLRHFIPAPQQPTIIVTPSRFLPYVPLSANARSPLSRTFACVYIYVPRRLLHYTLREESQQCAKKRRRARARHKEQERSRDFHFYSLLRG